MYGKDDSDKKQVLQWTSQATEDSNQWQAAIIFHQTNSYFPSQSQSINGL